MVYRIWILLVTIFVFSLIPACKKEEQESPDKLTAVEYFLTDEDKALFTPFQNNLSIHFKDSLNNSLEFTPGTILNAMTCQEGSLDKGEKLAVQYKCLTDYLPNFTILCELKACANGATNFVFSFSTGTFWTEKGNDYISSWLYLLPHQPQSISTMNYFGALINQEFADSLNLGGQLYHNVFIAKQSSGSPVKSCYYTKNKGLIAFKKTNGILFTRQ